jgi:DNA-binding response OmpR family regulator
MAKILIAEDDDSTRELLTFIVAGAGHQVATAADGQKALEALTNSPPDLVVLDVMLPEVHGYSVCHQVKSNDGLRNVKVLMLSAKSFPADRRQAEEVGADAFMSKPVNPTELLAKISSLLSS